MEKEINKILDACYDRREMGAKKYGKYAWMDRNMFQDMREELYDTINYALFQIMKINEVEEKMTSLASIIDDMCDEAEDCCDCKCKHV